MEERAGVYAITNMENSKVYVGSSGNLQKREHHHRSSFNRGIHSNEHLQRAWDKYGEGAFVFSVLEYVESPAILLDREQFWIDRLNSCNENFGYNMLPIAGSRVGFKCSAEHRRKVSEAAKERLKDKTRHPRYGKKMPKEFCLACRDRAAQKLDLDKARQIRERVPSSSIREVADEYGVSYEMVRRIVLGLAWKEE